MVDVWRHLCQHGQSGAFSHRCCITGHQLRTLADFRAQAFLHHLGTGEVTLYHVCACCFHIGSQTGPLLFVAPHDGRNEDLTGKIPFKPPQKLKILLIGMIGKLFDILKSHKRAAFFGQCSKARGCFPDVQ